MNLKNYGTKLLNSNLKSCPLSVGIEKETQKSYVRISCLRVEIWSRDLLKHKPDHAIGSLEKETDISSPLFHMTLVDDTVSVNNALMEVALDLIF